jgi:prevent-host-death family protein
MVVNTVTEAKTRLSELIEKAIAGQEIVISRSGKPVAVLTAYRRVQRPRHPGALRGKIRIGADFDTLPDDVASAFGMDPR